MLTYTTLQARPREFLAATGLTHEEFVRLLPAFLAAYTALYPSDKGSALHVMLFRAPHMDIVYFQ
jgi:hypothetical protein